MPDEPMPPDAAPTDNFDPAAQGWEPHTDTGFIGLVGPLWIRQEENGRRYGFIAEPKHHNYRGTVQGGMLMTFVDRALGMTAPFCESGGSFWVYPN